MAAAAAVAAAAVTTVVAIMAETLEFTRWMVENHCLVSVNVDEHVISRDIHVGWETDTCTLQSHATNSYVHVCHNAPLA